MGLETRGYKCNGSIRKLLHINNSNYNYNNIEHKKLYLKSNSVGEHMHNVIK